MRLLFLKSGDWKLWAAAGLSAALLELPFPLAGPLPVWRTVFAWFGLVPLLVAILSRRTTEHPRPIRRAFLLAYFCGFLWYMGNCYWVRDVMSRYGDMPLFAPSMLLAGYSLVLGLYFGLFGLAVALVHRATGSMRLALAAAPIFWAGLELAASRITSVPWDQLGYSQVDNALVNQLAPWTGVYGISLVLVAANALVVGGLLLDRCSGRLPSGIAGAAMLLVGAVGVTLQPPKPAPTASAVLVQPNLDVADDNRWNRPGEWDEHIAEFAKLAGEQCKTYIAGIPQTGASNGEIVCPPYPTHPDLVTWPESPAPFQEGNPRFQQVLVSLARQEQAPLVVGNIGADFSEVAEDGGWHYFNSALIVGADGARVGRYDKIHLVPWGEYIPYKQFFAFAKNLTQQAGDMTHGWRRIVFSSDGHRFGVFICYEEIFGDEIRLFVKRGAQVLVNISNDGWYGDTCAPWQTLNMSRMRAVENRRWLLRDTNTGLTTIIDPYGRLTASVQRHALMSLAARYGYRTDLTFYTLHGDLFAYLCGIMSFCILVAAVSAQLRRPQRLHS